MKNNSFTLFTLDLESYKDLYYSLYTILKNINYFTDRELEDVIKILIQNSISDILSKKLTNVEDMVETFNNSLDIGIEIYFNENISLCDEIKHEFNIMLTDKIYDFCTDFINEINYNMFKNFIEVVCNESIFLIVLEV